MASGMIAAEQMPASARASRSCVKSSARPHSAELTAQARQPQAMTRYLPKRSPSGPKQSCATP